LNVKTLREHTGTASRRAYGWLTVLSGDYLPALVLAGLLTLLVLGTSLITPDFLSSTNIGDVLTLLSALTFLGLGQFCVMVTGGIDLSIGPFAGLVVVVASFLLPEEQSMPGVVASCAGIVAFGVIFGLVQGWVIERLRVPAIVVTLASFIGLQGVSLLLRPTPAGTIGDGLSDFTQLPVFGIPVAMLGAIAVAIGLEVMLIASRFGRMLRAVGSDTLASQRLGVKASGVRVAAFGLCSGLAALGGLVLAGKVGIGSSSIGVNYTLTSITAVVLGGASVAGGRGSFLSTLMGAMLIQVLLNATTFLQVNSAWQYWLTGGATLGAASVFTLWRQRRAAA
jgi:ribose transport system ATP-binding protein